MYIFFINVESCALALWSLLAPNTQKFSRSVKNEMYISSGRCAVDFDIRILLYFSMFLEIDREIDSLFSKTTKHMILRHKTTNTVLDGHQRSQGSSMLVTRIKKLSQ